MLDETNPIYTILFLLFSVLGLTVTYVFCVFICVTVSMTIDQFFKDKKRNDTPARK